MMTIIIIIVCRHWSMLEFIKTVHDFGAAAVYSARLALVPLSFIELFSSISNNNNYDIKFIRLRDFFLVSAGNGKHMSGDEDSNLLIFLQHRQVDIRNELQAFEVKNIDLWLCVDALGLWQPNEEKKQSFPSIHRNLCGSIAFGLVSALFMRRVFSVFANYLLRRIWQCTKFYSRDLLFVMS